MTQLLDDTGHRARVRAVAVAIADAPRRPRDFAVPDDAVLNPTTRRRRHAPPALDRPRRRREATGARRRLAVLVLVLELASVVAALGLPAFRVHGVTVNGLRLLDEGGVISTAAVPQESIFLVDGDAIARRVEADPWVRSVRVTTGLPNGVRIDVTEWTPMIRVHRDGRDVFVAADGATLDVTRARAGAGHGVPLLIDDRPQAMQQQVSPQLVDILGQAAARFPSIFGVSVVAYQWEPDGRFSLWTSAGWRAILGHVETADAVSAVPGQLAALGALKGSLPFTHPDFGYIDLENPAGPAVGGSPGLPDEVRNALLAVATGKPVPSPPAAAATPAPSAQPGPSPSPSPQLQLQTPPSN